MVTSPAPRDVWDDIYRSDPHALPSLSPQWADAVCASGRYRDASRLYEFGDGRRAVLPLFLSRFAAVGPRRSPPAAWGFGGLAGSFLGAGHVRAVLDDLRGSPAILTQIRPNPLDAALWREAATPHWQVLPRRVHVLDLAGGFAEVWAKRFRQGARANVRRAEKSGLEVECGTGDHLVSEFHWLLHLSLERWAWRQHEPRQLALWRGRRRDPLAKFRAITRWEAAVRLWVARQDGQAVAAILVIRDREAHYTRGVMDEAVAGPTHANYLLHASAIEEACAAGCLHYNMGETGNSESLAYFKSRFGAQPVDYAEYRHERVPVSWIGERGRALVKRAIGFRDV